MELKVCKFCKKYYAYKINDPHVFVINNEKVACYNTYNCYGCDAQFKNGDDHLNCRASQTDKLLLERIKCLEAKIKDLINNDAVSDSSSSKTL